MDAAASAWHRREALSQPTALPTSLEEFFTWQERQAERYELVGGVPVRMMAGASNAHHRIVVNLIGELAVRLRGTGCRPFTADGSIETSPGQIRRPDVGVDCGRFDPRGYKASEPRLVAEVLSPSTRDFDTYEKVREYQGLSSLAGILLIEPNAPESVMWVRDGEAWRVERAEGLDAALALPGLDVTLALADLYEGITFPTGPRLAFGRLPEPG